MPKRWQTASMTSDIINPTHCIYSLKELKISFPAGIILILMSRYHLRPVFILYKFMLDITSLPRLTTDAKQT